MSAGNWRQRGIQPGQPGRCADCNSGRFHGVRTKCASKRRVRHHLHQHVREIQQSRRFSMRRAAEPTRCVQTSEPEYVGGGLAAARQVVWTAETTHNLQPRRTSRLLDSKHRHPVLLTPALVVHATACDVPVFPPPHLTLLVQPRVACLLCFAPLALHPLPLCSPGPVMCQRHFALPPAHVTACLIAWYW